MTSPTTATPRPAGGSPTDTALSSWGVRAAMAVIVLYFGSAFSLYKIAGDTFGPSTTNLIRFAVASVMLLAIARRHIPADRAVRWRLVRVGMLGLGLMAVLMGIGVDEGSAIIAAVVIGLEPIGVAICGAVMARDRLAARPLVALVIGFSGALVASGLFTETTGDSPVLPVVMLLGTVIAFSLYTGMVRKAAVGVHPLATAAVTQVGALAFVIPACAFDLLQRGQASDTVPAMLEPLRGMVRGEIQPEAVIAGLLIGIGSGVSYLLLCKVLVHVPTSRVAVSLYLTPVVGVLSAWLIVGESLHWRDLVGGALVLAAVAVSETG